MKPIKTKIHQGHDPFLDYKPMAEDMQGWGSTDEAFAEVIGQIRPTTIIEVGTWMGGSTRYLAEILPEDGIIYGVDTFAGSKDEKETAHFDNITITLYD